MLAVNGDVGTDEPTPWLELKGDRFISEIAFVYPAQSRRGKARLEIWGEYADSWFQPGSGTGAFATANNGWLYLGGQSPLFVSIRRGLGFETDVVAVARNRGFRSLRLDVKNRAITLNRIKVIYTDEFERCVRRTATGGWGQLVWSRRLEAWTPRQADRDQPPLAHLRLAG